MAPKKKEQQKMSLGDFLTDSGFGGGSWADEVEETYIPTGTQPLPPSDRSRLGGATSTWQDRGFSVRESVPQRLPDRPPFTAHLGNLSYDATVESVTEFFDGCSVVSVRIIEDREMQRPKGFGYVEFTDLDGLKKALDLDGESFQGRMIKIKIADPPRGGDMRGDSSRDLSDWTRKGPLPDLPGRQRQPSDFGGERRMRDPALDSRPAREMNWERRGPLAPLPPQEGGPGSREASRPRPAPEGLGERSESFRGPRPERPERAERAERTPTAAEKDMQWRDRMRPDSGKADSPSQEGSEAPSSPAPAAAAPAAPAPAVRPKLNLQKRTVAEKADAATPAGDSKAGPFGGARPIDTAAREREIDEKRHQAVQEKREADEKAKEERRLAKQAAKEAEAKEAEAKEAEAKENEAKENEAKENENNKENETENGDQEGAAKADDAKETKEGEVQNGASADTKVPIRPREAREPREPREPKDSVPNYKSRAAEAGNWRSASNENRGPRGGARGGRGGGPGRGGRNENRGPRANGNSPQAQQAPAGDSEAATVDEDGWTTVPKKGRQGRPMA